MDKNIFRSRGFRILIHVVIWATVLSLPYLLLYNPERKSVMGGDTTAFFLMNTFTNLLWVILFYLNTYLFIPRLIYKKKYPLYIAIILASFGVFLIIHKWTFVSLINNHDFYWTRAIGFNIPGLLLVVASSISFRLLTDRAKTHQLHVEMEQENLKTELSFLRSQISPHFVFNVLNNMLALARMKSDQLEPTIFKLSSLMRYMLYEADHELVPIKKEYEYLTSYIDLQRQRLGNKNLLKVEFTVPEQEYMIAPMLLVPFIENAFKHGLGNGTESYIHISLFCEKEVLHLTVKNSAGIEEVNGKDSQKGIGLANVKRRLDLLYRDAHRLEIQKEKNYFSVELDINLSRYAPLYSSRR